MKYYVNSAIFPILVTLTLLLTSCGRKLQLTPIEPAPASVEAENGMVVAAHPLAAEAGVAVLREGGNAVDAALATLFMLNVVEPHASGLGGGGFALVRMADGDAKVVVYREQAPRGVDTSFYFDPLDTTRSRMRSGATSVCVPGAAAGWATMFDKWATLPLERLARDAIDAAENGFMVDPTLAGQITNNIEKIMADSFMTMTFLKEAILPYEVGDTLRQPDLARTLETLVKRGLRSFYRGPIAETIVSTVAEGGGYLSLDDFAFFRVEVTDPIKAKYRGYDILTIPPPSSGGLAFIEALALFDATNATETGAGSPEAIHLMSQCLQQAYADAANIVEDGKKPEVWRRMIAPDNLKLAAEGISPNAKAGSRNPVGEPDIKDQGNTSHLVVIDQWGNTVSLTQSINYFFGAGVMAGNTGLLLNNQLADFDRPPATKNLLAPKKRPRSNMTPLIMLRDGKPALIVGTPGGSRIVAAVALIAVNVIDYDMDISAAIDYPRFFPYGQFMYAENRYTLKTLKRLKKRKYKLILAGPYHMFFGGAHGIFVDSDGGLQGAADKRRGGAARGY